MVINDDRNASRHGSLFESYTPATACRSQAEQAGMHLNPDVVMAEL